MLLNGHADLLLGKIRITVVALLLLVFMTCFIAWVKVNRIKTVNNVYRYIRELYFYICLPLDIYTMYQGINCNCDYGLYIPLIQLDTLN